MKQNVRLFRAAAIVAGMMAFSGIGYAQCKIAVVDMQEAVTGSNEGKAKAELFDARVADWKAKIDKLNAEIYTLNARSKQSAIASQSAMADIQKNLRDKNSELQRMQEDAQKDVEEYRDSLLSPVMKVADEVMNALATEKGYGIVFDSSSQSSALVYFSKECDVTNEVKTRLNAKTGTATPAAKAAPTGSKPADAPKTTTPNTSITKPATPPPAGAGAAPKAPAATPPAAGK